MAIQARRDIMSILIGIAVIVGIAGIALAVAVKTNGPLVLDSVDRLTGGSRGVALLKKANFGPNNAQSLSVFSVEGVTTETRQPVLLFVHGGGWNSGDPAHYGFVARALAPEGFIVVNAGYRLHPRAVYPAMLEDAAGAIAWTHRNIAQFGGDPSRIILAGHSAGAYNVVMTALDPQWLAKEGLDPGVVAGVVGLAGPFDFHPFTTESAHNSFGHAPDPELTQPINFAHGDAPPMLLLHGDMDETVKPRNSRALAEALTTAGSHIEVEFYPELDHVDPIIALASPWRNRRPILRELVDFAHSLQASVPVQGETR
jgi:acetyl esterase/lipase